MGYSKSRTAIILTSTAVILLAGIAWLRLPDSPGPTVGKENSVDKKVSAQIGEKDVGTSSSAKPPASDRRKVRDELITRWGQLADEFTGEELLVNQMELAGNAIKLGGSDEFLDFLIFLEGSGAGDASTQIIQEIAPEIFSGAGADEARNWLVTLKDPKLREKLCYVAGQCFSGGDLSSYIATFHPDDHSQSAVLTGYCITLAASDPEGAARTFFDLRPPNVTFDGYAEIMAALPPSADFPKLSAMLPNDSKGLARKARSELLRSWSTTNPRTAAEYVVSNSTLAFPEQMSVVVESWANQSPSAAAAWIEALPAGEPRDEGNVALARHWTATNPHRAWEFVGKVEDFNKRIQSASLVYKDWSKMDPTSAMEAWTLLYPPKE
jgi:hypothetical protein